MKKIREWYRAIGRESFLINNSRKFIFFILSRFWILFFVLFNLRGKEIFFIAVVPTLPLLMLSMAYIYRLWEQLGYKKKTYIAINITVLILLWILGKYSGNFIVSIFK